MRTRIYKRPPLAIATIAVVGIGVVSVLGVLLLYRLVETAIIRLWEYALELADPSEFQAIEPPHTFDPFPEYRHFGVWRRRR